MSTTWNGTGGNEPNTQSIENFQVLNMVYKIKKTNDAAKKKKKIHKIVPPLETLDNINRDDPDHSNDNVESFSTLLPKTIIEPMGAGPGDYECGDTVNDNKLTTDNQKSRTDIIEAIYQAFIRLNKQIATQFLQEMTGGKLDSRKGPTTADMELLTTYIEITEGIAVTCLVVYNWFYLMYYIEQEYDSKGFVKQPFDFSVSNLKLMADDSTILLIFLFVFEFALFFTETANHFFLKTYPKYTSYYLNGTFCFMLLFSIVCVIILNSAKSIKNLLIDVFSGAKQYYTQFMFLIVIFLFVKSVINFSADEEKRIGTQVLLGKRSAISSVALLFNSTILIMLRHFIRFMIIFFVSVPAGAIFLAFYFIFYSLFGILIYRGFSFNDLNVFTDNSTSIFLKIHNFIFDSGPGFKKNKNLCKPSSWFEELFDAIRNIIFLMFDVLYLKLFSITFLCVFITAAYGFFVNISTVPTLLGISLNLLMTILVILLILLISMYSAYEFTFGSLKQIVINRLRFSIPDEKAASIGYKHDNLVDLVLNKQVNEIKALHPEPPPS